MYESIHYGDQQSAWPYVLLISYNVKVFIGYNVSDRSFVIACTEKKLVKASL